MAMEEVVAEAVTAGRPRILCCPSCCSMKTSAMKEFLNQQLIIKSRVDIRIKCYHINSQMDIEDCWRCLGALWQISKFFDTCGIVLR